MIYVAYRKIIQKKECALYRKRDWGVEGEREKMTVDEGILCTIPITFLQV